MLVRSCFRGAVGLKRTSTSKTPKPTAPAGYLGPPWRPRRRACAGTWRPAVDQCHKQRDPMFSDPARKRENYWGICFFLFMIFRGETGKQQGETGATEQVMVQGTSQSGWLKLHGSSEKRGVLSDPGQEWESIASHRSGLFGREQPTETQVVFTSTKHSRKRYLYRTQKEQAIMYHLDFNNQTAIVWINQSSGASNSHRVKHHGGRGSRCPRGSQAMIRDKQVCNQVELLEACCSLPPNLGFHTGRCAPCQWVKKQLLAIH